MIHLYFDLSKFPRTIDRTAWKSIWRWKRETEKVIRIETQKQWEDLVTSGSVMINQSLLIHEMMDRK